MQNGLFNHVSPFQLVFIILSIACGVLIIVAGVEYITSETFKGVLLGLYFFVFGLATIIMELFFPPSVASWMGFYARWLGKGLWFLFLGVLILEKPNDKASNLLFWCGLVPIIVGVLYIIFFFLPMIQRPTTPYRGASAGSTANNNNNNV
mmetsp:Transcript_16398/g.28142  ORF Transcript_16398/g.28142 Transcript_16398/m.28142 type:complete len:150 (-) Transcript_16398:648-1097(-)